jgi:hypothetical protein
MTDLDMECLLASVGVGNVLRGKPNLFKYQVVGASTMPAEMRKQILKFLATDDFAPGTDAPDFDYEEVKDLVSSGLSPEKATALGQAIPDPELVREMNTEVDRIAAWANGVLPRETRDSVRGPIDETPPPAALGDFARLWQVAIDPMSALADMAEGLLSDDQVAALATCWPALYAEMRQALSDSMATMIGRRRTWEPTMLKAAQIATLKQEDYFDAELAAMVQATYVAGAQAEQQGPPPRKAAADDSVEADETPGQRAAGG